MRCLIVDDAPTPRAVMERIIARSGHRTTAVGSGHEAISAVTTGGFDVALVDLEMPGIGGADTIKRLRELDPDLRILVVSGHADADHVLAAFNAGGNGFLLKDEVQDKLGEYLQVVRAGQTPISPRVASVLLAARDRQLTDLQRYATIGKMAAAMVHEIGHPLTALSGQAEECANAIDAPMLQAMQAANPDFDARRWWDTMQSLVGSVRTVRDVVLDVSSFGRVGDEDTRASTVADVAQKAIRLTSHATQHCARVRDEIAPDLIADIPPSRLAQVLMNLIVNAAQAIRQRHDGMGTIVVRARSVARKVIIEVEDDGIGMTEAALSRIFDRPSGIGLSITRDLVTRAGGHVQASSKPGRGSLFRVVVPAAPASGKRLARIGTPAPADRRQPTTPPRARFAYGTGALITLPEDEPDN